MKSTINRRHLLGLTALVPASIGLSTVMGTSKALAAPELPSFPLPLLPQQDPMPLQRQSSLAPTRLAYVWSEDMPFIQGIPAAWLLPPDAAPTAEWMITVIDTVITLGLNLIGSIVPQINGGLTGMLADSEHQLLALRQRSEDANARFAEIGGAKPNQIGVRPGDAYPTATSEEKAQASIIQAELMDLFKQVQNVLSNVRTNIQLLLETNQSIGNFGTIDGLARYNSMWQGMPIPAVSENLHDDELFAYMRIGGFNTTIIKRVEGQLPDKFSLTDVQYKRALGVDDTLGKAISEGRVFIVDYVEVSNLATEHATYKILTGDNYNSAPIAVFAVAPGSKKLQAVAIQCGQDPEIAPMFIRPKPDDEELYWGWQMAKTVVQTADFNHHEMVAHLSHSHLVSEAFTVATFRAFAPNHPLGILLRPHFEGNIFVNILAAVIIMAPNTFADAVLAPPIDQMLEAARSSRMEWDFYERMPHRDFVSRGVDDTSVLSEFPYRDDALLVWDAMTKWVKEYIHTYYANDDDVVNDSELVTWVDEAQTMGKIKGFREITSREQLIEVVTMVLYTASAYHAAVNYPQTTLMTYVPFAAGTMSTPPPERAEGYTEADWIKMLPGTLSSLATFYFLNGLGSVYYRPLGDYRDNFFPYPLVFTDPRITGAGGPLARFRENLISVEAEIHRRNKNRSQPYEYLLPSNIPTSTNV
ncbi:MAG: lipoxygenase family protein [Mycobacteriaceae bacterium]